jgi:hypothetical protein
MTQGEMSRFAEKTRMGRSRLERKFVHDVLYGLLMTGMPQPGYGEEPGHVIQRE